MQQGRRHHVKDKRRDISGGYVGVGRGGQAAARGIVAAVVRASPHIIAQLQGALERGGLVSLRLLGSTPATTSLESLSRVRAYSLVVYSHMQL